MSLINSKNIKRLMLLIISLLTAMLSNIASNVSVLGAVRDKNRLNFRLITKH